VLDCQNGIPFFTPLVLPRNVPVLCVVHHVHTAQFTVHFPAWMAWVGRLLEGAASRLAYRRQACVAVSPSNDRRDARALRWTGDVYLSRTVGPVLRRRPAADRGRPGPTGLVWIGRLVAHKRAELVIPVAARGFTIDVIGAGLAPRRCPAGHRVGTCPGRGGPVAWLPAGRGQARARR